MPTRSRHVLALAGAISLLALVVAAGCSENNPTTPEVATASTPIPEVVGAIVLDAPRLYSVSDLTAAGLTLEKTYDLTGLPGAVGAYLMSFDQNEIEGSSLSTHAPARLNNIEVRVFPTHAIAVAEGIPIAAQVVGQDVNLAGEQITWDAALNDQRTCQPGSEIGFRDCTRQSKYGDFVTYSNLVLLCEGIDVRESRALCQSVIAALAE